MMNRKKISKISKWLFIGTILFLTYVPLVVIMIQSVNSDANGTKWGGFSFEAYLSLFNDDKLLSAITITLLISTVSTLISTIFGTLAAIGIHALNTKLKRVCIFLNNVPIINADIVTGIFLWLIFSVSGTMIGLSSRDIFGFHTLLIAHVMFSTPYVVLSVLPKISDLDSNLFDAALDLGCKPYQALIKIILPSIKSAIFVGMFFAFTMSIDDFIISYFVSGDEVSNFSTWLYSSLTRGRDNPWPKSYAYSTMIFIVTIISVTVYTKIKTKKKGV